MKAHLGASPYAMWTFRTGDLRDFTMEWTAGWTEAPVAVVDSVRDTQAYTIGQRDWCTATVRWILGGHILVLTPSISVASAWCSWETRVLLTAEDEPGSWSCAASPQEA